MHLGSGPVPLGRPLGPSAERGWIILMSGSSSGQVPLVASRQAWHDHGMVRIRVSTTVDESLIQNARRLRSGLSDAALLDEALGALVARHRTAEIDAGYATYDDRPLDESDEWGDLASFREAAASS